MHGEDFERTVGESLKGEADAPPSHRNLDRAVLRRRRACNLLRRQGAGGGVARQASRRTFSPRPSPVANVVVPSGGNVRLHSAYDDARGSGFVLVLGHWARGSVRVGAGMADVNQRFSSSSSTSVFIPPRI